MELAAQSGADGLAFLSGPAPQSPGRTPEAIARFTDSMLEIAAGMAPYPHMSLLLEPLDRKAHKRNTVGTTREAAGIIRRVREVCPRAGLVWDSAHAALNGEPLEAALAEASDAVRHIHLCNAVLRPGAPGYGDFHIPPGPPGYLDERRAAALLAAAAGPWEAERTARRFLESVLP